MASLLYFSSNSEKLKGTAIKHNHCIQIKKCRVDIVTMRSIVRGERCNIFACVRCVSLLALLAANEPLVSAVTERKVSEVKTANMLKRKHMLLYAFPANMNFIIYFPVCMCGKASLCRSKARKVFIPVFQCLCFYYTILNLLIFIFIHILFEHFFFIHSNFNLWSISNCMVHFSHSIYVLWFINGKWSVLEKSQTF